jgi:hypothetical protein
MTISIRTVMTSTSNTDVDDGGPTILLWQQT